ncbi:MAG: GntR family transcriptional regulator [Chloroflexota bacterium]|nr:GntR family transcriptional regulator [Chloroflexota bacterium]
MPELARIKGIPLYVQIRETIREQITSGELPVGSKLFPEEEIAERFGVSRMTARRALADLVREGLLLRKQGVGTLVASRKITRNYSRLTSFYEGATEQGRCPASRLLDLSVIPASADLAPRLMIEPGTLVMCITRLRLLDGAPIALHIAHVMRDLCPALLDEDLEDQSLYRLYDSYGLKIAWAKQRIEARAATKEQAHHLGLEPGAPVLYSERTTYMANNTPIEWVQAYASGAPYAIEVTLFRGESAPQASTMVE